MGWNDYGYFKPTHRRTVAGGIKAQTNKFGTSWWAKRWIAVLEGFNIGARLGRGKSYARSGQVLSIEIYKGGLTAKVQGSRRTPYTVSIEITALTMNQWQKIASGIKGQALFSSKLLSGEMPDDIEQVFTDAKIPLFPREHRDLKTDCSCPDWSNPCKHIAAVYYLLGLVSAAGGTVKTAKKAEATEEPALRHGAAKKRRAAAVSPVGVEHRESAEQFPIDSAIFRFGAGTLHF